MLVKVEPTRFVQAADLLASANLAVAEVASVLFDAVADGWEMTGHGHGARAWSLGYDASATAVVERLSLLVSGLAHTAPLLDTSGANHARADAASLVVPFGRAPDAPHRELREVSLTGLQSSYGGDVGVPRGWHWLAHRLDGLVWPGADIARLRALGRAWAIASAGLRDLRWIPLQAADMLDAVRSPEIPHAVGVCTRLAGELVTLADACGALSRACRSYADQVGERTDQVAHEVKEFVKITAISEITGGVLAFFTASASELFTQLEVTGVVARYAERITSLLRPLDAALVPLTPAVDLEADSFLVALNEAKAVRAELEGEAAGAAAADAEATAASGWANPRTLTKHFLKHRDELGVTTEEEYVDAAHALLKRAGEDHLPMKIDHDGTLRVFEPDTGLFGTYDRTGRARTIFRPKSPTYWDRQRGILQ